MRDLAYLFSHELALPREAVSRQLSHLDYARQTLDMLSGTGYASYWYDYLWQEIEGKDDVSSKIPSSIVSQLKHLRRDLPYVAFLHSVVALRIPAGICVDSQWHGPQRRSLAYTDFVSVTLNHFWDFSKEIEGGGGK